MSDLTGSYITNKNENFEQSKGPRRQKSRVLDKQTTQYGVSRAVPVPRRMAFANCRHGRCRGIQSRQLMADPNTAGGGPGARDGAAKSGL